MSSDLDSLGLVFSALFDAQQQGAKQTGGTPPFQVLDGLSEGIAGTAEAVFNALHPGAISQDIVNKVVDKVLVAVPLGGVSTSDKSKISKIIAKKFESQNLWKVTDKASFEAAVRAKMASGMPLERAIESVKEVFSVNLQQRKTPSVALNPHTAVQAIFNPKGFVDSITGKVFGNKPSTFWKVLIGGSAIASAGLSMLTMRKDPYVQTPGDAVFIAGATPDTRKHAWTLWQRKVLSAEQMNMAFDHALDMTSRAVHYVRSGKDIDSHAKKRIEQAKLIGDAIARYAVKNNLKTDQVLNDWNTHKDAIKDYMLNGDYIKDAAKAPWKRKKIKQALEGISDTRWERLANTTWIASNSRFSNFRPRDLLRTYGAYLSNKKKFKKGRFTGDSVKDKVLNRIIAGTTEMMAQSAERHRDNERARHYRGHLQNAHFKSTQLNFGEKLYWWKQRWDFYSQALGPKAGFGLLTGDFFLAASGAPLFSAKLKPKVEAFSLADNLSALQNLVPTEFHGDIADLAVWRKNNKYFGRLFTKLGDGRFVANEHNFLTRFVKAISLNDQNVLSAISDNFLLHNGIPLISKRANFLQRNAYIAGTLHPYQLLMSFLDGSLGDRLMYIGLDFGRVTSPADFARLSSFKQRLFKWGLKLNNNKFYRAYRQLAVYLKLAVNAPAFFMFGLVNKVKGVYAKAFKALARGANNLMRRVAFKVMNSRIGQKVFRGVIKKIITKILDGFTGGLAEVGMFLYNVINQLTGGLLDQIIFKGVMYTILIIVAWIILGIGGLGLLANSAIDVLTSPPTSLPSENYQYVGKGGWGTEDLDPEVVAELLKQDENKAEASAGILGAAGGNSDWLYSGKDLGISTCAYRGYITQMWCNGASTYHVNHEALDIYGGEGRVPVYAIVSGTATCIRPGSSLYGFIRCRDGSFAGNGILLRGTLPDGRSVMVWHLHIIQCTFEGTQRVEAGQAIGLTAGRSDLKSGNCWSGPHLHIHWTINGQKAGADLYCTLKKSCGGLPFAASISGKCDQAHLKCGN